MRELERRPYKRVEVTTPRGESLGGADTSRGIRALSPATKGRELAFQSAVDHRIELDQAVTSLRKVYEEIGVDQETIDRIIAEQAEGSDRQPLLKTNTVFTINAGAAAEEFPSDAIAAAKEAHAGARAQNVALFNATQRELGKPQIQLT